jgi:hypothetical protein
MLYSKNLDTLILCPSGKTGTVTIPGSVISVNTGFPGLTAINVASDNPAYSSADGILYSKNLDTLILCPDSKTGTVTIPNSVISIGDGAFHNCSDLTSITIPNSVTSIGDEAFLGSGLTSVTIPNSVTSIGDGAFSGTGLTSITIPNNVTSIGDGAFWGCTGLTSVTIGNSVISIGEGAFHGCTGLTSVTSLNPVPPILGLDVFGNIASIVPVFVSKNSVGAYSAAPEWSELQISAIGEVVVVRKWDCGATPGTVTAWLYSNSTLTITGTGAMEDYGCGNCVPWDVTRASISEVIIENGVTSIGSYAFSYNIALTSIAIPSSVTAIGWGAFSRNTSLTAINVASDNLAYSSADGVLYSKKLDTLILYPGGKTGAVTIPSSVTSIGDDAFSGYTGPMSVTVPNSVTNIGDRAFWDCTGLTSITIPNSVASIGVQAFQSTGLTSITIPNSVTSIGIGAFSGCSGLTAINVASGNLAYSSVDGILYSKNLDTLIQCPGKKTGALTIPNSVTSIGIGAFSGCTGLTGALTIPNSVTSIGIEAFSGCTGLTGALTIPNSVTSIGGRAFYGCSGLTSIDIGSGVTSIEDEAFHNCSGLTSITFGSGVTSIGYVFSNCTRLMSVTSLNPTPPIANYFDRSFNITLYVPANAIEAYSTAVGWRDFSEILAINSSSARDRSAQVRAVSSMPKISVRGKTLTVSNLSSSSAPVHLRVLDLRGRTVSSFNAAKSDAGAFTLTKIPAGRYLVEVRRSGVRVGTTAIMVR